MKNILARGGIEFLAVLLGISASLWIDNNNKKEDLVLQREETYQLLENQTDSLLSYTNNMLDYYEMQGKRFGIIIDQWESIQFDTIKNQSAYVRDIWAAFSNAFYPDFSTYETLVNSGQINFVNFETINSFGRLFKSMDIINSAQNKESEWRDFLDKYFNNEYAKYAVKYNPSSDLFTFLKLTKTDPIVFSHLKSIAGFQAFRKNRVQNFKDKLVNIQNHLAKIN
ncbi:uncharacterized protein METZ01_LOCUS152226 [marine metagenome]|uniref:Uncharacterized protein n=1 Tax=marine metagenome TaxID=408172 RepID=A0A382AE53_9ZZZZ